LIKLLKLFDNVQNILTFLITLVLRFWLYFNEILDVKSLDLDKEILDKLETNILSVLFNNKNNEFD
jgi:hypothetical protein